MAKKKEETKEQSGSTELDQIKARLEEHEKTFENFRTSFANLETTIRTLKERNRLR